MPASVALRGAGTLGSGVAKPQVKHLIGVSDPHRVRPSAVRNRAPRTGLFWLLNSYGHAREHLAQLQLTEQLFPEIHQSDLPDG